MENQEIQTKIEQYAKVFSDAREKVGDEAALVIVDQIGKHMRVEEINAGSKSSGSLSNSGNGEQPATDKQIAFMKQLGLNVPEGISKQEASAMLDQELEGGR